MFNIQCIPTPALWIDRGGVIYRTVTEGTVTENPRAFADLIGADNGDTLPVEQTGQESAAAQGSYLSSAWQDSNIWQSASDQAAAQGAFLSSDWLYTLFTGPDQSDSAGAQADAPVADWLYVLVDHQPTETESAAALADAPVANHN